MSCYFLESTAFAKLFVQEPGTDALIRLIEAVEDNRKLMEQTLHDTEKVVKEFQAHAHKNQIPVEDLTTNPFRLKAPKPQTEDVAVALVRTFEFKLPLLWLLASPPASRDTGNAMSDNPDGREPALKAVGLEE